MSDEIDPGKLAHLDQVKAAADAELDQWLGHVVKALDLFDGDPHQAVAFLCQGGHVQHQFHVQPERFLNLFMTASMRLAQQKREQTS